MVGDAMLTLFWIVGITNAFNLLDNMDGLCAGMALIGGAFLLIVFVIDGAAASPYALYLAALLGATAGFLVYNFNPASIFMGDSGSLFLGLNVAALTLVAGSGDDGPVGAVVGRRGAGAPAPHADLRHDFRHRAAPALGPSSVAGRARSHVSSAGRRRPLRAQGGDDAVDARGCRRSHLGAHPSAPERMGLDRGD